MSGSVGGTAGTPSLGGGGNAGAGGGGGAAGAAGGGSDPTADLAAVAKLNGFQLLDPCDLTNYTVSSDP